MAVPVGAICLSREPTFGLADPPQAACVAFSELASIVLGTSYLAGPFGLSIGITDRNLIVTMLIEESLHHRSLKFSHIAHTGIYVSLFSGVNRSLFGLTLSQIDQTSWTRLALV